MPSRYSLIFTFQLSGGGAPISSFFYLPALRHNVAVPGIVFLKFPFPLISRCRFCETRPLGPVRLSDRASLRPRGALLKGSSRRPRFGYLPSRT